MHLVVGNDSAQIQVYFGRTRPSAGLHCASRTKNAGAPALTLLPASCSNVSETFNIALSAAIRRYLADHRLVRIFRPVLAGAARA